LRLRSQPHLADLPDQDGIVHRPRDAQCPRPGEVGLDRLQKRPDLGPELGGFPRIAAMDEPVPIARLAAAPANR